MSSTGAQFQFAGMDLASFGSPVVDVEGLLGGSPVATDAYTGPDDRIPGHITVLASNLTG